MQRDNPSIIGMTVFGSMSRVKEVTERSDVDGTIFIEIDDNPASSQHRFDGIEGGNLTSKRTIPSYKRKKLEVVFRETIRSSTDIPKSVSLRHVRCLPISQRIIEEEIAELASRISEQVAGESLSVDTESTHRSTYSYSPADSIALLFHRAVPTSGRIAAYRKAVIDEIKKYPEISERVWNRIATTACMIVNSNDIGIAPTFKIAQVLHG